MPDVNAGSNITYTVTLTNNGPSSAQGVQVSDAVPAETTLVSAVPPAGWTRSDSVANGGTGTLVYDKTAAFATADGPQRFSIVVNVNGSTADNTTVTNTATATSTTADPSTPNTATATTTVFNAADVEIVSKTDTPDPVVATSDITYTIAFINRGPNTANSVTVTDPIPDNTTFVSAAFPAGWGRTDGVIAGGTGDIVFAKASVAGSETALLTLVVKVNAGFAGTITNTATAATVSTDPIPLDNSNSTTTTAIVCTPPPPNMVAWYTGATRPSTYRHR